MRKAACSGGGGRVVGVARRWSCCRPPRSRTRQGLDGEAVDALGAWLSASLDLSRPHNFRPLRTRQEVVRARTGQRRAESSAQRIHGFTVQTLPGVPDRCGGQHDRRRATGQHVLATSCKGRLPHRFPARLSRLGLRNRQVAQDMALGETTQGLAIKHKVSQGGSASCAGCFTSDCAVPRRER